MFLKPWLSRQSIRFAPVVMISSALALVLLIGCWGMYRDLRSVRESVTNAEITQIRSHAERTARRIENELSEGVTLEEFASQPRRRWLDEHWRRTVLGEPDKLYSAVLNKDYVTLAESGSLYSDGLQGDAPGASQHVPYPMPPPRDGVVSSIHRDVRMFQGEGGRKILDLQTPIMSGSLLPVPDSTGTHLSGSHVSGSDLPGSDVLGFYRTGIDTGSLETKVRAAQSSSIRGWSIVMAGTAVIVVFACLSLYRLGVHSFRLEQALSRAETRRLAELNQLIVGLAHEVRNPLNAVRLNLFTSEKVIRGDTRVSQSEAIAMLHESVGEIERVDGLIGQLLGYARINGSPDTCLDVNGEIGSTLQFLKGVHERENVDVQHHSQEPGISICIGQQCFRQILLNLLQNAAQAAGPGGKIHVSTYTNGTEAVVSIHDSGPGVSSVPLTKIFEPFYSTRENGVGMGLAVVKSLVENAGGLITCRPSSQLAGMEFLLTFPIMKSVDMSGSV